MYENMRVKGRIKSSPHLAWIWNRNRRRLIHSMQDWRWPRYKRIHNVRQFISIYLNFLVLVKYSVENYIWDGALNINLTIILLLEFFPTKISEDHLRWQLLFQNQSELQTTFFCVMPFTYTQRLQWPFEKSIFNEKGVDVSTQIAFRIYHLFFLHKVPKSRVVTY